MAAVHRRPHQLDTEQGSRPGPRSGPEHPRVAPHARLGRVHPALTALPRAPPTATSPGHLAPQLGILHCVLLRRYRPRRRPCAVPGRAALAGEMDEYGCEDVDFGGDGDMTLGEVVLK